MELINIEVPFFLHTIKNHVEIKDGILSKIASMGVHSLNDGGQSISNTDWKLPEDHYRPYFTDIQDLFESVILEIQQELKVPKIQITNYWFQQYSIGDFHPWHHHANYALSSVYYVNLANGSAKTTFEIAGKEFEIDVKEGQILTFCGFSRHTSKPTKSDKTIIAFNSVFIDE
jgi:hypothetical protein